GLLSLLRVVTQRCPLARRPGAAPEYYGPHRRVVVNTPLQHRSLESRWLQGRWLPLLSGSGPQDAAAPVQDRRHVLLGRVAGGGATLAFGQPEALGLVARHRHRRQRLLLVGGARVDRDDLPLVGDDALVLGAGDDV